MNYLNKTFIHKITGERLFIKKVFGQVVLCKSKTTRVISDKPYLATNTVVCSINNLII